MLSTISGFIGDVIDEWKDKGCEVKSSEVEL